MDLDRLGDLARRAYHSSQGLRSVPDAWDELLPTSRESWRAAADAVRMACETPLFESLPGLRERIAMQLAAQCPVTMPDKTIIERAKVIESYILGSDGA